MASRPRIGALISDAIEQKGLKQGDVAGHLGVSRSAVNAWANDRAYPAPYVIVALEKLLEVKIPRTVNGTPVPDPADRDELELWDLLVRVRRMRPADARGVIEEYRRAARRTAGRA